MPGVDDPSLSQWNPSEYVSRQQIKSLVTLEVADPSLFMANTAEQRQFLQMHKDILVPSPQEQIKTKYVTTRQIYMALPYFVRVILALTLVIFCVCVVPVLILCLIRVCMEHTLEVLSIAVLAFVTYWVWHTFIRQL